MQANEFDELLRGRLDAYEPEYSAAAWEQLAARMQPPRPKRRLLLPLAIGVAASLASAFILVLRHPDRQHSVAPATMSSSTSSTPAPSLRDSDPATDINTIAPALPVVSANKPAYPRYDNPSVKLLQHEIQPSEQTVEDPVRPGITENKKENNSDLKTVLNKQGGWREGIIDPIEPVARPVAATTVSLAGGIQYGTLKTGYTAGINVRHNVSTRWAVETELSYSNYGASGTQQLSTADYNNLGNPGLVGVGTPIKAVAASAEQHPVVQYITASPALGYKVFKGLTVWGGMDFQRAIQAGDEKAVQIEDDEVKLLPLLDVGATGKAEFAISRNLQAGILYRVGINNAIQKGNNYLERRYLQVQLKIPLLRK